MVRNRTYIWGLAIAALLCTSVSISKAGLYHDRSQFLQNVKWIYIELLNLEKEDPKKQQKIRDPLKRKTAAIFRSANLTVRLTEKLDEIGGNPHLKIRVHKIILERTVYLSSIEFVTIEKGKPDQKQKTDLKLRYRSKKTITSVNGTT